MEQFAIAASISIALVLGCTALFFEILSFTWRMLAKLEGKPQQQMLFTVMATFLGHTICVWLFGIMYYVLQHYFHFGTLTGQTEHYLFDYVYFSAVSYSTLGLGDVAPSGGLRLLVGVEAILGLLLVGWTITFSYLVTEKYLLHRENKRKR